MLGWCEKCEAKRNVYCLLMELLIWFDDRFEPDWMHEPITRLMFWVDDRTPSGRPDD